MIKLFYIFENFASKQIEGDLLVRIGFKMIEPRIHCKREIKTNNQARGWK